MFIEPLKCSNCGKTGRPGEQNFTLLSGKDSSNLKCKCGNIFPLINPQDQMILSSNIFVRLGGASNHVEWGNVKLIPGKTIVIKFTKPFDLPCKAFFSPKTLKPFYVRELNLNKDRMLVLSAKPDNQKYSSKPVELSYSVYGLVDLDNLPLWYVHFYSAIVHATNGFFKPALLDYAVAFEAFVEVYLQKGLSASFNKAISDYLLQKTWKIEARCKELLKLATGHSLGEQIDLYQSWLKYVKTPRDKLMHGKYLIIGKDDTEQAHQAIYQTIRWIENLK